MTLFAHIQHWLWALYLPPALIVAASVAATKLRERRGRGDSQADRRTR